MPLEVSELYFDIVSFSPITPLRLSRLSLIVLPSSIDTASNSSMFCGLFDAASFRTFSANAWNWSFLATKSVSELIWRMWPVLPSSLTVIFITPSLVSLSLLLAAFRIPFFLKSSRAFSMSLPASSRAFLQSTMPAPLCSRSFFIRSNICFEWMLDYSLNTQILLFFKSFFNDV